jgi:O-antigen/teichoic acid export membrane protein
MLRKLTTNTIAAALGLSAQKALGFVTTLVLARGLGEHAFGIYSFVSVYIFFFGFLVDLGMERVVTRELAEHPERIGRLMGNALLLKLALSAIAVPAAVAIAWLAGIDADTRYCILVAAMGLPLSLQVLFRSYFESRYQVKYTYAVTLPGAALFLLLAAACVVWRLPVYAVFYAGLVHVAVTLGVLAAVALRRVRLDVTPDRELLRLLLRDAGEVGLFALLFTMVTRIDQVLLFQLRGAADVAQYGLAVRVSEGLALVPQALMMTLFPVLAASRTTAPERFRQTCRLAFKYLSAVIVPVALLLTFVGREVVRLLFGAQYGGSTMPMIILVWGMFFAYTGAVYLNVFIIERRQRLLLAVSTATLTVNIAMNLWLIPAHGATGAALATVGSDFAGFVCWMVVPVTWPLMAVCLREVIRPLASLALAGALVAALALDGARGAALALAVYAGMMAVTRGVSRGDLVLVRALFATPRAD